jgi:hypothetical protein
MVYLIGIIITLLVIAIGVLYAMCQREAEELEFLRTLRIIHYINAKRKNKDSR